MKTPALLTSALLALATAALGAGTVVASAADGQTTFTTAALPAAPGLGLTTNEDAEPGMGVDGDGVIWIASDVEPYAADDPRAQPTGVLSGADVWKSTDAGATFQWVAAPFQQAAADQSGAGGEDTDIAVAPEKNSTGHYNVYAASLWVGSTSLAVSQDGGATWTVIPVNGEPVQDRPWLSADGPCAVYITYHAIAPYDTVVDKMDFCNPSNQGIGSAVDPTQTTTFVGNIAPGLSNRFGKPVVDNSPTSAHRHRIYVPMMGCDASTAPPSASEVPIGCTTEAKVFVGVSDDGVTYTNHVVANTGSTDVYIWPDTVATDAAGNVYVAWFDGQHSYLSTSSDGGTTWSPRVQVNSGPAVSTAYPTVAAGPTGQVEVAYYGTDRAGKTDDQSVMKLPNTDGAAQWYLYWAESTDGGATFTQSAVSDVLHTGVLCTSGGGCDATNGDRNLLDDFGMVISPTTGLASITFDNDQPGGTQGHTHTDFATEAGEVGPTLPEASLPLLLPLVAIAAGAGAWWLRRRRARLAD
jgi:hypothetical protein